MRDIKRINLLVADDHPVTREGLALILDNQPDMRVVAQGSNGQQALDLYFEYEPDVALLDLQMPVLGGTAAIKQILARDSTAKLIALTTFDGDEDIYRAMHGGAKAYLLKDTPTQEILRAIRWVYEGRRYAAPEVEGKLLDREVATHLSERELDVVRLIGVGQPTKSIARQLSISEGTVKTHIGSIMAKLGATRRTEIALIAMQRGFLRS